MTPQEALVQEFQELPKSARSFGFDNDTYWFMFEVSHKSDETIFMDSKNIVGEFINFYIFDEDILIKEEQNGYLVPIKQRNEKLLQIRFALESNQKPHTYLVKIQSHNPHYTGFAFGSNNDLKVHWDLMAYVMVFTGAIFFALSIYNTFLYLILKDKTYLYYCIYLLGFFGFNIFVLGYLPIFDWFDISLAYYLLPLTMLAKHFGMTFFAIHFLNLEEENKKLKNIFIVALFIHILLSVLYLIDIAKPLFALSIQVLFIYSIFVGFKRYLDGFKPAFFYLAATGVSNLLLILFVMLHQGDINYTLLSINLPNIALVWDMILLSLALAYRIKLLQEENLKNQRLALIKSKQTSIGELSGNIAHQWRHPLAELNSILMNMQVKLEFSKVSTAELISQIKLSSNILQHLSSTIDTFQSFFQNKKVDEQFCVNDEIQRCIDFMKDSLANNDIKLTYSSNTVAYLNGNSNEFSQIIMNIVLNAKDILIEREMQNGYIHIELKKYREGFKIEISDNGGGIKLNPIDLVFDSYTTTRQNGIGIGLFIVRTIVEKKFKGTINAYNYQDGAVFEIKFNL